MKANDYIFKEEFDMNKDVFGTVVGLAMLAGAYLVGKKHGRKDAFGDVHRTLLESIVNAKEKEKKEAKES